MRKRFSPNGGLIMPTSTLIRTIHSGGGGYTGYMTSAGVTVIADGSEAAEQRLALTLTNDTATGVMRYADAGYEEALSEAARSGVRHFGHQGD